MFRVIHARDMRTAYMGCRTKFPVLAMGAFLVNGDAELAIKVVSPKGCFFQAEKDEMHDRISELSVFVTCTHNCCEGAMCTVRVLQFR